MVLGPPPLVAGAEKLNTEIRIEFQLCSFCPNIAK